MTHTIGSVLYVFSPESLDELVARVVGSKNTVADATANGAFEF